MATPPAWSRRGRSARADDRSAIHPTLIPAMEVEVTGHSDFTWFETPDRADGVPLRPRGLLPRQPPVAGGAPVAITAADLAGLWSLRFGMFGCADSETRGGVVHVGQGLLGGGDSAFAYLGQWTLTGIELRATLDIARHNRTDPSPSIFGGHEDVYHADCIAHAITPDLFEGRIRRPGYPDARLTMHRMDVLKIRDGGAGDRPAPPSSSSFSAH